MKHIADLIYLRYYIVSMQIATQDIIIYAYKNKVLTVPIYQKAPFDGSFS
jgi:hypothetical protein